MGGRERHGDNDKGEETRLESTGSERVAQGRMQLRSYTAKFLGV